jgi:DNA-binding MarR family transcriptional regulator
MTTRTKRKYVRLSPSKWAELRAYWEAGDHSLAELSDQYGVSPRAIQSHLSKLGTIKGSKACGNGGGGAERGI